MQWLQSSCEQREEREEREGRRRREEREEREEREGEEVYIQIYEHIVLSCSHGVKC